MQFSEKTSRKGKAAAAALAFMTLLTVFVGVLAALYVAGIWKPFGQVSIPGATQPSQPPSQPQQPGAAPAGFIFGQLQDIDTAAPLASSGKVDVIDPASMKLLETITTDANGKFTSTNVYEPGRTLLLHVYYPGYYDKTFTVTVPSSYTLVSNSYYYPLGVFQLKKRVDGTSLSFKLLDPTGSSLSSATGSAAAAGWGTYTATSTSFNLQLLVSVSGTVAQPVAFGYPMPYITSQLQQEELKTVVWVAFNSTAINLDKLRSAGFERMQNAPSNVLVVYKVLDPIETNKVNTASTISVNIPVDTSSIPSGTNLGILIWIADLQRPADAAIGVKMTSLTAYGPFSGYGVTTPLGQGYTAPSSAAFTSSDGWLRVVVTTA